MILYSQRTTSEDGLTPLHQEFGYIRVRPNNLLEMTLCDPAGTFFSFPKLRFIYLPLYHWKQKNGFTSERFLTPTAGLAYVLEGTFDAESKIVQLKTRSIASSSSAKEVKEVTRELKFTGSNLRYSFGSQWFLRPDLSITRYTLSMAAMGHPLQEHLKAVLERVE